MPLTADEIERCALGILDRYGLGDLSMRRIAATLDVAPGALYWHVPNKQQLLIRLARRIVGEPAPAAATAWAAGLTAWAHALRSRLLAHRDGAELVSSAVALAGPESGLDPAAAARALLRAAGFPQADATAAAETALHYVLGQTLAWQARDQFRGLGVVEDAPVPDSFDFGLTVIVDGLAARYRPERPGVG
ncbi:AcrR family transcriptional regulator [Naumannella cuiyingiana]|uniref:AcrR family transcriptional regulator n=1 Tax=Naumannella cuiyingiana TaxID=1347891 RepID=A0A7Z0D7T7_9ACTN|nr:TetR/AcrR family transcriptional regulator [Naumannella cuiyingiana]NYI70351.1 AcrR family transcriptional regulator [Naumannella cuiyingiana]